VSENFSRPEDISHHSLLVESIYVRRWIVLVLSSDSTCCKFSVNQRRRKGVEANLLHKHSTQRSGRTVSIDREIGLCTNNSFQEVETLLPSLCHQCHDGSSTQEGNEQVGSHRTTEPIGYRAQRIWHQIPT